MSIGYKEKITLRTQPGFSGVAKLGTLESGRQGGWKMFDPELFVPVVKYQK